MLNDHRLPTYAISHGGGPWPWIKDLLPGDLEPLERSLQQLAAEQTTRPLAVLIVSAHWVTRDFSVSTATEPPMIYDYGGFPEFTYHLRYPAPGAPEVARRALELAAAAGIEVRADPHRGLDHGVFVPMYVSYPAADMPTATLSVRADWDPEAHLALGRALAPLRDEGVLIIGSGLPSFHDLSALGPASRHSSAEFDRWLTETILDHMGEARSDRLRTWSDAPCARQAHPREDHLVPLFVAAGAAENDPGFLQYHQSDFMGFTTSSSYRFGTL